jgi:D-3-phosphoglycerate dehydrogenase
MLAVLMNLLVADKFEESGLLGLRGLGLDVAYEPTLEGDALGARLAEGKFDVLVVRSTKVTAPMIAGANLGLIIRAGAGVNTIDVATASERGVLVANCPGKNSQAVAELAFGLILACDRRIADNVIDLRNGIWNKKEYSKSRGLHGRTLGLVGLGHIAQAMIPIARAFGMHVAAFSRWMTAETAAALNIGRATTLEELAAMSDVVSVHVALTPETRASIGENFFQAVRPGFILVNTSRAEVVDQDALLKALGTGKIAAGLDVFEGEPSGGEGTYEGPLRDHPRAYVTHHIGASTEQAQESIAAEVVRIVHEYRTTGSAPNVVNVIKAGNATHLLIVRHLDRVGVLAHVLGILKDEGINVQEMENIVLGGAKSAIAQVSVDKEPTPNALLGMKLNPNIFDASIFPIAARPASTVDPVGL